MQFAGVQVVYRTNIAQLTFLILLPAQLLASTVVQSHTGNIITCLMLWNCSTPVIIPWQQTDPKSEKYNIIQILP